LTSADAAIQKGFSPVVGVDETQRPIVCSVRRVTAPVQSRFEYVTFCNQPWFTEDVVVVNCANDLLKPSNKMRVVDKILMSTRTSATVLSQEKAEKAAVSTPLSSF
jgi:hypothetical protein